MSSKTDPAGFDPEVTGAFRVQNLAARQEAEAELTAPMPLPPLPVAGPALMYHHSDGNGTVTRIDRAAPAPLANPDDKIRELMIARALLRHALHLVDKELNGL